MTVKIAGYELNGRCFRPSGTNY